MSRIVRPEDEGPRVAWTHGEPSGRMVGGESVRPSDPEGMAMNSRPSAPDTLPLPSPEGGAAELPASTTSPPEAEDRQLLKWPYRDVDTYTGAAALRSQKRNGEIAWRSRQGAR